LKWRGSIVNVGCFFLLYKDGSHRYCVILVVYDRVCDRENHSCN
jgi:hypothetical protein